MGLIPGLRKALQNKIHTPTVVGLIKTRFEFTVAFLKLQSILKDQILFITM